VSGLGVVDLVLSSFPASLCPFRRCLRRLPWASPLEEAQGPLNPVSAPGPKCTRWASLGGAWLVFFQSRFLMNSLDRRSRQSGN